MSKTSYRSFARRGAELRVSEIEEEIRAIMSAFPDLYRGDLSSPAPAPVQGRSLGEIIPGDRRRRPRVPAVPRQPPAGRATRSRGERRRTPRR